MADERPRRRRILGVRADAGHEDEVRLVLQLVGQRPDELDAGDAEDDDRLDDRDLGPAAGEDFGIRTATSAAKAAPTCARRSSAVAAVAHALMEKSPRGDAVLLRTELRDPHLHHVAGLQIARRLHPVRDAGRRAGGDEIARAQ